MNRGRITNIIALGLALAGVATARGQEAKPADARPAPVEAPAPKAAPRTAPAAAKPAPAAASSAPPAAKAAPAAAAPAGSTAAVPEAKPAAEATAAPSAETPAPAVSDADSAPETAPAAPEEKPTPHRARPRRRAARPAAKPVAQAEAKSVEAPAAKTAVEPTAPAAKPAAAAAKPAAKPFLADYEDPKAQDQKMPLGRVILDLIWKLAVVLAVAYAALYALRGLMVRQGGLPRRKGALRVLESATLAPNRSIHLVRVAGKVIVIGSTPEQITTLSEIDDPDALAKISAESAPSFAARLDGVLADDGQPSAAATDAGSRGTDAQSPGDIAGNVRDSVRHLWDQVQQVRGLRPPKGGPR